MKNLLMNFKSKFLVVAFTVLAGFASAQCVGFTETGNTTGNVAHGGGSVNWANPNRTSISDNLHARVNLNAGEGSKFLLMSDFFTTTPLPADAIITGIEITVEKSEDAGAQIEDQEVRLYLGGPIGNNQALPGEWSATDQVVTYGGPTDMWGTALTVADLNNANFGFVISATRTGGAGSMSGYVDDISITVYYNSATSGCPLPVELEAFRADVNDAGVELEWVSVTENNNSHFTLSRSFDGGNFFEVTAVQSQGNGGFHYAYVDGEVASGVVYYQLSQTDINGNTQILSTIMVNLDASESFEVAAGPNPFMDDLKVTITGECTGVMKLYDMSGRMVESLSIDQMDSETKMYNLNQDNNLLPGIYYLKVNGSNQSKTIKLIKQ